SYDTVHAQTFLFHVLFLNLMIITQNYPFLSCVAAILGLIRNLSSTRCLTIPYLNLIAKKKSPHYGI
ncbi:hypothetical protein AB4Z17_19100, partial [Paenibacillus sp. TAF43_2]|uniref:hypothetical protein n=1 Tax=Paenibacillus sp. TAF43_2 TaxID=3233069 RepID=UPI003F9E2443